jgi:hypothetical protein
MIRVNTIRTLNRVAFGILGLDAVVLTYWVALLIWISISEPGSLGILARSFHIGLPITMFLALSMLWEVTYEDIRARKAIIRFRGTIIWIFFVYPHPGAGCIYLGTDVPDQTVSRR